MIQIPCFNEEETLPETLADIPREVKGFDKVLVLVIDDGSTDDTARVAGELGVDYIVSHRVNMGLAAAFRTGIETSLSLGADVIVNTDADNQYKGSCIGALTVPILSGSADVVVGERPIRQIEEFSKTKKILQRFGTLIVRIFSGTEVRDAASGFRAFSRDAASRLRVYGKYSYTMETLVQAGWEGMTVVSVPVGVNPKTRNSRLVKNIPQYIFRSASTIVRTFALYKPFRFFATLSAPFLAMGSLLLSRWLLLYFFSENYTSRLPSLLSSIGCFVIAGQLLMLAFIADLISVNRRLISDDFNLNRSRLGKVPVDE